VAVLCGRAEVRPEGVRVRSLAERFGEPRALEEPRRLLQELAADLAREVLGSGGHGRGR
jgi:hypothetical protein